MENRFYRELSRRLAEEGILSGQPEEKGLPVLLHSRPAVFISASGLAYMPEGGDEEEREVYHRAAQMSEEVLKYTQAVEQASVLEADTLDTEYRLLAEYGGVVLAGKEMERGKVSCRSEVHPAEGSHDSPASLPSGCPRRRRRGFPPGPVLSLQW